MCSSDLEDLLPFSNERLVRAVAASRAPVVSAIGHEQDVPLVDLAADLRASTPTDAAKRIVPDVAEQLALIASLETRAHRAVARRIDLEDQQIEQASARMLRALTSRISAAASDIEHLLARLRALSPAATLDRGYAIVQLADGSVVRDPKAPAPGDALRITVAEGALDATTVGPAVR